MSDSEDPRWAEDPLEAAANVQRLYDSDVPFFTKDRIREAYRSLQENNERGKKAYTRDLDGKLKSYKIQTGEVFPDPDDDSEWMLVVPTCVSPSCSFYRYADLTSEAVTQSSTTFLFSICWIKSGWEEIRHTVTFTLCIALSVATSLLKR
jgi:hypothetical protein